MLILFFIIGIIFGSFFNVIIDRLPRGESIIKGRSHCEYCQHILTWYDLIPLFSFLLLKGKCRYCHKFIGIRYPLIECTTGIAFLFLGNVYYLQPLMLFLMLGIVSSLIIIFYTDLFSGIIPDAILLILGIFALLRLFFFSLPVFPALLCGVGTGLFFLAIFLMTKGRGMGFGDVKYAIVMGILVGFPVIILSLYVAFLTGATVALILVLVGKRKLKGQIAFGPFLVLGTLAGLFAGNTLWTFFLHILGF